MELSILVPIIVVLALFLVGAMSSLLGIGIKLKPMSGHGNLPPGTSGWPVIGETLEMLRANFAGDPLKFTKDRVEKYKSSVFRTRVLGEDMAVLCGPAGNKFLFANEGKKVAVWWPKSVQKLIGPCLINMVGDEARVHRKMLMSFFNMDSLMKCIPTMDKVARNHIATRWEGKDEIKVYPNIKDYTFELACRLFMSISEPEIISMLAHHFRSFVKGVISIPVNVPGTRFYSAMRGADAIRKEIKVLMKQRISELENKVASPSQDLMSYLLSYPDENGKFISEQELINDMLDMLYAGHDTSSSTIMLIMKYLGELPRVRDKVFAEQREIAASKKGGDLLNWEDLQKMRYTWNVVSEVMRIMPPVNGTYREALVDIEFDGYTIPKGWKLHWVAGFTHYDPNCYPKAMQFDESRFEGSGPPPYSYVPFGGGPRMCLGKEFARLEILVFLHNFINRFDWDLLVRDEKIIYDPMPNPVNGLHIHLRPRS